MGSLSVDVLGSASWRCSGEMMGPLGGVAGSRTLEVEPKVQWFPILAKNPGLTSGAQAPLDNGHPS